LRSPTRAYFEHLGQNIQQNPLPLLVTWRLSVLTSKEWCELEGARRAVVPGDQLKVVCYFDQATASVGDIGEKIMKEHS